MPDPLKLEKAELREVDAEFKNEINSEKNCKVQFNPESLKVSFANQVATPSGAGDQKGTPARQFVGAGTTKLSLQLWFDVSAPMPVGEKVENDVRKLTAKVAYFITPKQEGKKFVPPAVRFMWGSFQFDGIMESLEESLEFFSNDGRPLRASVTINLTQQKITEFVFRPLEGPGASASPGTRPLTEAPAGSNVQKEADKQGKGDKWQDIAAANNIENPRMLQPGQLLDMNASVGGGASFGASVGAGVSFGASASLDAGISVQGGLTAQTGVTAQAGVSLEAGGSIEAGVLAGGSGVSVGVEIG
jgi:Contractile injection system tube protein